MAAVEKEAGLSDVAVKINKLCPYPLYVKPYGAACMLSNGSRLRVYGIRPDLGIWCGL